MDRQAIRDTNGSACWLTWVIGNVQEWTIDVAVMASVSQLLRRIDDRDGSERSR